MAESPVWPVAPADSNCAPVTKRPKEKKERKRYSPISAPHSIKIFRFQSLGLLGKTKKKRKADEKHTRSRLLPYAIPRAEETRYQP
jgi:hypothetical protein